MHIDNSSTFANSVEEDWISRWHEFKYQHRNYGFTGPGLITRSYIRSSVALRGSGRFIPYDQFWIKQGKLEQGCAFYDWEFPKLAIHLMHTGMSAIRNASRLKQLA